VSDWSPLADDDPVPGDPDALADLSGNLSATAERIRSQVERLRSIDTEFWEGEAAEAFRERESDLPDRLSLLVTRYHRASAALGAYAPRLGDARAKARAALAQARTAEANIEAARQGIDAMEAETAAAREAAGDYNAANPDLAPRAAVPYDGPPYRSHLDEAESDMAAARALLDDARELRDGAARTAGQALDAAVNDDLENEGGFFAALGRVADDVLDAFEAVAPILSEIAGWVGVAALVLAWVPVLGQVLAVTALVLGGIALVMNLSLAISGRQGWGPAVMDAIGVASFGVGRAAAAAGRTVRTTRSAYQGGRAARGAIRSASQSRAATRAGFSRSAVQRMGRQYGRAESAAAGFRPSLSQLSPQALGRGARSLAAEAGADLAAARATSFGAQAAANAQSRLVGVGLRPGATTGMVRAGRFEIASDAIPAAGFGGDTLYEAARS